MMRLTGRILSATAVALLSTSSIVAAESMDALIAAAKKEGQLTTIALPHDW
jgi:putative spermidine/putrescine transport system substrate-binding protein